MTRLMTYHLLSYSRGDFVSLPDAEWTRPSGRVFSIWFRVNYTNHSHHSHAGLRRFFPPSGDAS